MLNKKLSVQALLLKTNFDLLNELPDSHQIG